MIGRLRVIILSRRRRQAALGGQAKTVNIERVLSDLDPDKNVQLTLNFSSRTSSLDVQRILEDNVEKRLKNTYVGLARDPSPSPKMIGGCVGKHVGLVLEVTCCLPVSQMAMTLRPFRILRNRNRLRGGKGTARQWASG